MRKIYGATERQDGLYKIGRNKWELIYGFVKDDVETESGYNYRERYDHEPSLDEVKSTIISQINADTDAKILNGYEWNGISVWLSTENQINFKAAYDLAVQTNGSLLPVIFKLGEDADGNPKYYTFDDIDTFTDFYVGAVRHITTCIQEGWAEKDSINLDAFACE